MIKSGGYRVVDWIWRLCNVALDSGVVPKDWRFAVVVPLYKVKERGQNTPIIGV